MENQVEASDSGRKVTAVIVGVLLIIVLVLLAKWTGDKIRDRFAVKPKPVTVAEQLKNTDLLGESTVKTATYSAIPKTGPNDWLYAVTGILFVSGLGILRFSKNLNV